MPVGITPNLRGELGLYSRRLSPPEDRDAPRWMIENNNDHILPAPHRVSNGQQALYNTCRSTAADG